MRVRQSPPRLGQLGQSIAAGGVARITVIAASLVTLPLVTHGLGLQQYGVYVLLTAMATLLPLSDLGVSLGLVTMLPSEDDADQRRRLVSTTYLLLSVSSLILAAVGVASIMLVDWTRLLGVDNTVDARTVNAAVLTVTLGVAVSLPANVAYKILLALQQGKEVAAWQAVGAPVTVTAVASVYALHGGLIWYIVATVWSVQSVSLVATYRTLRRHPELRPRARDFDRAAAAELLRLGLVFSTQGSAAFIGFQTDAFVLTHVVGLGAVAVYNVAYRLYSIVVLISQNAALPLWPAFGSSGASATDRHRRLLKRTFSVVGPLAVSAAVGLVIVGDDAVRLWVGRSFHYPLSLALALAAFVVVQLLQIPLAMYLSGFGVKRFQIMTALAMAAVNLPLSIWLAKALGIVGPALGSAVGYGACILLPSAFYVWRRTRPIKADLASSM